MKEPVKKDDAPGFARKTILGIVNIIEQLHSLGHKDVLRDIRFTIPVDAEDWIYISPEICQLEKKWWPMFEPLATFDAVSISLCDIVMKGQFSNEHLAAISVTQEFFTGCVWDSLASAFEQRLSASTNPHSAEIVILLKGLSLLRQYRSTKAQDASKRLAEGGHLMHDLFIAHSEGNIECSAWCIVTFLAQQPNAAKPQIIGNADAGYSVLTNQLNLDNAAFADKIIEILHSENNLKLLLRVMKKPEQPAPLIIRCLRTIADNETPEIIYTPDEIIGYWDYYRNILNEEASPKRFQTLISYLCEKASLVEAVQNSEGGFRHKDAGLYLAICQISSSKSFCEWCQKGLETINADTWSSTLLNGGDILELMLTLMDIGIKVELKQPYQDALVTHAKHVLAGGKKTSPNLISKWPKVLEGLGKSRERAMLRKRLREVALKQEGKFTDDFIEMYGNEIADYSILTEDNNIVLKLFIPIVIEHNVSGLRWLTNMFRKHSKSLLDNYTDRDSVDDFRERIQGKLDTPSGATEEVCKLIVDIANTLEIKPKEEPRKKSKLEIIKAEYWTEKEKFDVTEELRKMVSDDKLETVASNDIKGDPDPGTVKKLSIEYKFDDITITKDFTEGDKVLIPLP
jgi:hypothetical protein